MAGALERYDPARAPEASGLHNTGVICHFNALLQALAGCTSVARAALAHRDYLSRTRTGRAFHDFFWATAPRGGRPGHAFEPRATREQRSAALLRALVADLRERRPGDRYGPSQESATEGLVLLLDMLEPSVRAPGEENPIARLFYHRYEATVYCLGCRATVSEELDVAVQFNLFHFDALPAPPATPAEFGELLRGQVSRLEGYACGRCGLRAGEGVRRYRLRMVPEVLVCVFNLYGPRRPARYFPTRVPFPGAAGETLWYRWVAQVEHHGSLGGGHYVAAALRAGGAYRFDDERFAPTREAGPGPNVYAVFYHAESATCGAEPNPPLRGGATDGREPSREKSRAPA